MMYPRLYLARNLLREDGVIFISIDDNEVDNLRKLCDEVFGEENFIAQLRVEDATSARTRGDDRLSHGSTSTCSCYARSEQLRRWPGSEGRRDRLREATTNPDGDPRGPWTSADADRTGRSTRRGPESVLRLRRSSHGYGRFLSAERADDWNASTMSTKSLMAEVASGRRQDGDGSVRGYKQFLSRDAGGQFNDDDCRSVMLDASYTHEGTQGTR